MKQLLSEYDFPFLPSINFESEWEKTSVVVNQHPWLNFSGYFRDESQQIEYEYLMSSVRAGEFKNWLQAREAWEPNKWNDKYYLDQIYRSRYWLSQLETITTFNRNHSSYGLKHYCEDWWKQIAHKFNAKSRHGGYICNGSLIVAGLSLGWKFSDTYKRHRSLNVDFPISEKSLKRLTQECTTPVI
jgi:hypothetical protein